jgi:hypothetical protein
MTQLQSRLQSQSQPLSQILSRPQRSSRLLLVLFAAVLFALPALHAQSNYGAIRGAVTDSAGAALDRVQVVLTSEANKLSRTTVSNGSGEYLFGAVDPGTYTVTAEIAGFQKLERKGIIVDSGNTIPLDLKLTIGSQGETVEVTAAEPLIDAGTSYNGQLIDSQKLQNLPNPGRNPFLFSKLDNNVTPVGDPRFVRFQDQSGSSTISVAGAPLSSNNYSIDGVPITDFSNRAVIIPSIEAVEEVKLQANTYDGEIGRTSGGMFNTTLHSGSSRFHGVLQGETRQTNWGANLYFNNRTPYKDPKTGITGPTTPRGAAEFYSYVGAIGGPIPLPEKLGGKDKTFFWIAEEGYRQRSPLTAANSFAVPTALELTGDFSEIGNGVVNPATGACGVGTNGVDARCIYDPLSPAAARTTFPGNKIPVGRINMVGQALLNAYPKANTTLNTYAADNFNGGDTLGDRADEFNGKLTHQFGERWLADFYYLHYGSKEPGGNALTTLAGSSSSYLLYRKVDAVGIQNTITLNPTTLLTVGFGFNRFPNDTRDISSGFNQATLGFPANYLSALSKSGFPAITADSGLANEGTSNSGPAVYFSRNTVIGLSKNLGKHSLKTGYVYRAISLTFKSLSSTDGTFAFDSTLTAATAPVPGTTKPPTNQGATAADMLLGYPTSGSLVIPAQLAITTAYQATYLQDDWRVTPRLTLNLGFRYEYEPGVHERNNHYAVGFDRTVSYSAFNSGVTAVGGVEFAGQNGYPTSTGKMGSKYSPRFGFAYGLDPKTVVRGGFGVFYAPLVYAGTATLAPGYVLTNSIPGQSGVPSISLSNPFPNIKTQATGNANGLSQNIGTSLTIIDQSRRAPLYESYSFDVERELPLGFAVKIGYVGGHGRNLPDSENINQLPDPDYALTSSLTDKVRNAYAGLGNFGTGTVNRYQTLLPFPQYQGISDSLSIGRSDYNALDIKVQKRLSRGLTLLAGYTWSSNWDNIWGAYGSSNTLNPGNNGPQDIYNISSEYARATNDIPNRFTVSGTYELPFGHGKQFLGDANRWVDLAVGGWRFNDITILQNGGPLALTQSNANASFGNSSQRPTIVPGVNPCNSGSPESRLGGTGNKPYFNPAAFTTTGAFQYGNQPRASNCYGPGYVNSDLSLNKDFTVREGMHVEFRAEALNAFNTPEFNGPNLAVDAGASAGKITGTLGFPRLVQLGGRFTF